MIIGSRQLRVTASLRIPDREQEIAQQTKPWQQSIIKGKFPPTSRIRLATYTRPLPRHLCDLPVSAVQNRSLPLRFKTRVPSHQQLPSIRVIRVIRGRQLGLGSGGCSRGLLTVHLSPGSLR
jgi:hypothetical protein